MNEKTRRVNAILGLVPAVPEDDEAQAPDAARRGFDAGARGAPDVHTSPTV